MTDQRKPQATTVVTQIRLPTPVHQALQAQARDSQRSLNAEMVHRLKSSLTEEATNGN